jgi:pectate lyase
VGTPRGFAGAPALGLNTTTGGAGGRVVTPANVAELQALMDSNEPLIIRITGTMDFGGITATALRSNKTIVGIGANARLINGGLELYNRSNIIIQNITFVNAPDDWLKVNQGTHHVWVDHCTFTDGDVADPAGANHDGLFDITRQSSHITISYCLFLNHAKTILIGHSDSASGDLGYLKTTLHHNWFNGTRSRHPRVRFGQVHVYNNYYRNNDEYGIASTMEADVLVEGNYFENVPFPMYVGYAESGPGDIVERNNIYAAGSGAPQTRGTAFSASSYYTYTLDAASSVPAIVSANAGAGKVSPP